MRECGVQNDQPIEAEVGESNSHRRSHPRRISWLDLYADTAAALEQQQIALSALEGRDFRAASSSTEGASRRSCPAALQALVPVTFSGNVCELLSAR